MKHITINKIESFFKDQLISEEYLKNEYFESIYDITENVISNNVKNEIALWLEYFLQMNYSKERIKFIENIIDLEFIEYKIQLLDEDNFNSYVIKILNICSNQNLFENHLEFNENSFFLKVDPLKIEILKIINDDIN